jgi:hypothetical protein
MQNSMIDKRVLDRCSFYGTASPTASNTDYSGVQLWNPSNSGKIFMVRALRVWTDAPAFTIRNVLTPLESRSQRGMCKYWGAPPGTGDIRFATPAALPSEPQLGTIDVSGTWVELVDEAPFIIEPNSGMSFWTTQGQSTIAMWAEWEELAG